jgi:hypothetical protein
VRGHSYYLSALSREKLNLISFHELCPKIDLFVLQILAKHLLFARHYGGHLQYSLLCQGERVLMVSDEKQRTELGDINDMGVIGLSDGLNVEE